MKTLKMILITLVLAFILSAGITLNKAIASRVTVSGRISPIADLIKYHSALLPMVKIEIKEIRQLYASKEYTENRISVRCIKQDTRASSTETYYVSSHLDSDGNTEVVGIPRYFCGSKNYGCFGGNCKNGVGIKILSPEQSSPYNEVIFGKFEKTGFVACGIRTMCNDSCKVSDLHITNFSVRVGSKSCVDSAISELAYQGLITQKDYETAINVK
jgi:hypothetical protein